MSKNREVLSPADLAQRLRMIPNWSQKGNALVRTYPFPSYLDGLAFVNRVAQEADRADHHPTIELAYDKVTVTFSTHSAGGITALDVEAAMTSDNLALAL